MAMTQNIGKKANFCGIDLLHCIFKVAELRHGELGLA